MHLSIYSNSSFVVKLHIIVLPCIIYSIRKVRPHIFAKKGVGMIIHVNGNHWIRAFVNMESRSISVADSLAGRRSALNQCSLIGKIIKKYLIDEQHRLLDRDVVDEFVSDTRVWSVCLYCLILRSRKWR
jgi:hypothetical protein